MTTRPIITRLALAAALCLLAPGAARAARVAMFNDGGFVDRAPETPFAEPANVQAALEALGHDVTPFEGTSSEAFAAALVDQHLLLIPELEVADLAPALTPAARATIASFVAAGGGLVLHGFAPPTEANLLSAIFALSIATERDDEPAVYALAAAAAEGTAFAGGPESLPWNNGTGIIVSPLPLGSRAVYRSADGVSVALIPYGEGAIVFLGWDWFKLETTTPDRGWNAVLDAAVRELADRCGNGVLDPGERCDDGNTRDGDCCSSHCLFEALDAVCGTDGNLCTLDFCDGAGTCVHAPVSCDDGNACTDDGCDSAGTCLHVANAAPCDDGSACTTGDTCSAGSCVGTALGCDDSNPCTAESCDPLLGCTSAPLDGAVCDNGDACQVAPAEDAQFSDVCSAGACVNRGACGTTAGTQPGRKKQVVMSWRPSAPTTNDQCTGQLFAIVDGGKRAVSRAVRRRVNRRTGAVEVPLQLNAFGRKLLGRARAARTALSVSMEMTIDRSRQISKLRRIVAML
jgi:cysteine-rich repeat protein